ncbi:hypothetical protein M8J76_002120 [Diaphorina citri]|nr:hypothetical protein M8J76_002120 [Diaphorina citri]
MDTAKKTTKTKNTAKLKEKTNENECKQDKKKLKKRKLFEESSEEDVDDPDLQLSDEDPFNIPPSPLALAEPEEVEYFKPTIHNVKAGTYILISVLGGYRKTVNYKYVCSVLSVVEDVLSVVEDLHEH